MCNYPRCGCLTDGDTYCVEHSSSNSVAYNTIRGCEQTLYNSTAWKKLRKQKLTESPLCEHCAIVNEFVIANVVHHIVEVKHDWNKRLDMSNLVSLCNTCHARIHAKTRKK